MSFISNKEEVLCWLKEEDSARLEELWQEADRVRAETVGNEVHLRGLIEFSNICRRNCAYCGIRAGNTTVSRYQMERDEVLECAGKAAAWGYGTVVLQSGEFGSNEADWLKQTVCEIKKTYPALAVTLSVGERPFEDYRVWREAGADRFLLRLETSNEELYQKIHPAHPGGSLPSRIEILCELKRLGYEAGSGVMIGIPGQTYETLADDLLLFRELDLDMIGMGPFIAHPETPLGRGEIPSAGPGQQVPATELMTYKMVALTRLLCPESNIPSTTALATLNTASGRELGLARGANVVMPNLTPPKYRALYEIYPSKACIQESAEDCRFCLQRRIESMGRRVGQGNGGRFHHTKGKS